MVATPIDVTQLPEAIRAGIQQLAEVLVELAGDDLRCYAVIGPALMDDFDAKRMHVQSVAVLARMDMSALERLRHKGVRIGKKGLRAPLIMTPRYIDKSRDAFPVELIEIQQLHTVVVGEDPFVDLAFQRSDVRLQCERELKRCLIQLRQGLLSSAGRDRVLAEVCTAAAEHVLRVLRALVWLAEQPAPRVSLAILEAAEKAIERDFPNIRSAISGEPMSSFGAFERFYGDIESLADLVDEMSI